MSGQWQRVLFLAAMVAAQVTTKGQGSFQNLGFESAIVPVTPDRLPVFMPATNALPGWTVYYGDIYQQSEVIYNGVSIGGVLVTLIDRHTFTHSNSVIRGNFTATLDAGSLFFGDGSGMIAWAAIAQTGTIPAVAKSLLFDASGDVGFLQAAFDSQVLPFFALSSGTNYTRYGADISGFSGQSGELRFTERPDLPPRIHKIAYLDNITFSELPIPEPGAIWLFTLGLFLSRCRRQRR